MLESFQCFHFLAALANLMALQPSRYLLYYPKQPNFSQTAWKRVLKQRFVSYCVKSLLCYRWITCECWHFWSKLGDSCGNYIKIKCSSVRDRFALSQLSVWNYSNCVEVISFKCTIVLSMIFLFRFLLIWDVSLAFNEILQGTC